VVVDGEMPEEDYDLLVDIIRRTIGEAGQMSSVGRSFAWYAAQPGVRRSLHISVVPRGGKTTIHVSENLRGLAGGLFGGIMGGAGGGTGGVWMAIGAATHNPLLGVGLWLGTVAGTYGLARGIFVGSSRRRARKLRELTEALATQARESIAAAKRTLGRSTAPRLT
jgi:predicted lipid-binding transport protein (Tim44 family)